MATKTRAAPSQNRRITCAFSRRRSAALRGAAEADAVRPPFTIAAWRLPMNIKTASMLQLYTLLLVTVLLLFACTTTNSQVIPPPTTLPAFTPQPTVTPRPTSVPTAPSSPTPVSTPISSIVIENQPDILYETIFTIPVGEAGVTYQGVGIPGMEITGPNALAILPDMSFFVADLIGNRLLRYDSRGKLLKTIDLYSIGIVNVADLRATNTELILLEISFKISPERYRVNRLSFDGELAASYDIPEGYHLENGLTGISVDCEGEILLELEGGYKLYRLVDSKGNLNVASTTSDYLCYGKSYRVINPGPGKTPTLIAGNIRLETQLTTGFGGLRLLGVLEDGSFYVIREDVVSDDVVSEGAVDQTVHYISADGLQLGLARVPIAETYYYVMRNLAIGPDGYVYALLPQPDSVHIIRLNFFRSIEPLVPSAVTPLVIISNVEP